MLSRSPLCIRCRIDLQTFFAQAFCSPATRSSRPISCLRASRSGLLPSRRTLSTSSALAARRKHGVVRRGRSSGGEEAVGEETFPDVLQETRSRDVVLEREQLVEGRLTDLDIIEGSAFEAKVEEGRDPNRLYATTSEGRVLEARQRFRDALPEGLLEAEDFGLYERLYGKPGRMEDVKEDLQDIEGEEVEIEAPGGLQLLREDSDGGLEEVEVFEERDDDADHAARRYERAETRDLDLVEAARNELLFEESDEDQSGSRSHPLTLAGRFATSPTTISLPRDEFVGIASSIFSDYSNKHISEMSHRLFGGPGLPHSASTMAMKRIPQRPIPLEAGHHQMGEMEANAYVAAVMPATYATIMSAVVEIRKRLGSTWIEELLNKNGGPSVLDAGAGGAGILAWREVLKAEWARLNPNSSIDAPFGKSTVLAGSSALRRRSSEFLENTTFLPRLPDYVHTRDRKTLDDDRSPQQHKQFDLIIAPHTLWPLGEDYLKKQQVQNLWSMLNPAGGVLLLIEKGTPRGFENIAGARDLILERFIASPGTAEPADLIQTPEDPRFTAKGPGMIIAPCTNHAKCPMYLTPGHSKGREDFCHFSQRFIRPPFLQRIHGMSARNHEDVKFSYIAAQRGVDQRRTSNLTQGNEGTVASFLGHEDSSLSESATSEADMNNINTLSLPRTILPAMKRKGHVILDVCTPAGRIERWTVPKSFSKQAYHDARKAQWGDLWALGAKSRVERHIRPGRSEAEVRVERKKEARERERESSEVDEGVEQGKRRGGGRGKREMREKERKEGKGRGERKAMRVAEGM